MFNHCTVEALRMRWLKRDRWKAGIAFVGVLLLLVFIVCVPVSAAGAYEGASRLATSAMGTVQATPTVDATVTALSKEQLTLQVKQQQSQQNQNNWWFNNSTALIAAVVAGIVAFIGILQWAITARQAKNKDLMAQAEERFKTAVTALGDEKEGTQVGGAILLRSFLNKGDKEIYERYYTQIFDLAVANLRHPKTSKPQQDQLWNSTQDPGAPLPPTALSQALSVAFKEAFPLARQPASELFKKSYIGRRLGTDMQYLGSDPQWDPRFLDASAIQLDNAFLAGASLEEIWMQQASLRSANLRSAKLPRANLKGTDLSEANLSDVNLSGAQLHDVILIKARLHRADLSDADFDGAHLSDADFEDAHLQRAIFLKADLSRAKMRGANLRGANLLDANLADADLQGAKYNRKVIQERDAQGRLVTTKSTQWPQGFDLDKESSLIEDSTPSPPWSTVSPPPPSQNNNIPAQSTLSVQRSAPPPDPGGSNTVSSQQEPKL